MPLVLQKPKHTIQANVKAAGKNMRIVPIQHQAEILVRNMVRHLYVPVVGIGCVAKTFLHQVLSVSMLPPLMYLEHQVTVTIIQEIVWNTERRIIHTVAEQAAAQAEAVLLVRAALPVATVCQSAQIQPLIMKER